MELVGLMSTPGHPTLPDDADCDGVADRAAALVNPSSGLANDYLNVFNEIVMMIDLLPEMPDLADNIAAWSPMTYRRYFTRSTLAGREDALKAYKRLDPAFRAAFDRCTADLSRAARAACANVLNLLAKKAGADNQSLATHCHREAQRLRARLDTMTEMVNGNRGIDGIRSGILAVA